MPAFSRTSALRKLRLGQSGRFQSQKQRKMLLEGLENRLAMAIDGLAVAGDSWSDEYAAESYNYGRNWAELLVSQRGIDLGAAGNFSSDNRGANGTAFNWAQVNTTTVDLLLQLQDISITDQYTAGDISHVVLMEGMSEFAPGSEAFTKIADGTWNQTTIDSNLAFSSAAVRSALAVLMGVPLKGIVTTIPDPTVTPQGKTLFDATARAKVRAAVDFMNVEIKKHAAEYHVPVVDLAALQNQILGTAAVPKNSITVGGNIYNATGGIPKTNLFIDGGVLPHTVYQAYIANAIIEGLNFAYNENIPRLTEQQIVALAGQTYGGSDTFPVNYSSLVIAPPVTVYLSYGSTGTPADDFTARVSEWATARGISQLTPDSGGNPGELSQLKANLLTKLQNAFTGTVVNFTGEQPSDTRFEAVKLGVLSDGVPGALTSRIGQSSYDWLNASEQSTGFVFVDLITRNDPGGKPNFDNINLATLSRADQLRYLENVLSFYIANEVGRGMGLQAADAFGYPSINSTNAANTNGVQFLDFMSGDPALGFNTASFNGPVTFSYSPLAKAKLQYGHWLTKPSLTTIAESGSAHNTIGTAQTLALVNSSTPNQRAGLVRGAAISVGSQVDLYKIAAAAVGDKITAQTFAAGVYGAPIDTNIRILAADGTVLASSDNTLLGNNSIGQTGTTNVSTDSLVMNYVVATAGDIFVEVTAKASGTGSYDLMVTNTVINNFPWHNVANPLNASGNTTGTAVTAFDVIPIINELNNPTVMNPVTFELPVPSGSVAPPPYLDVSPNGKVTAFDAIPIINYLNINPLGGPGNPAEFVPFEEESAGEATAPEAITAPAEEEPSRTNRSAATSSVATALPYQPANVTSSLLASQSSGRATNNFASNPLTWLLLAPVSATAGEETEEENCPSSEAHAAALEQILTEE
jgi:hypothetical protein